mmetsp:Transcript_103211/g.301029  ORF Transcript_103211/g.301029 Transcript_103211/m.301029 type:complete len:647 (+) Transcript_103211:31-1971(+)
MAERSWEVIQNLTVDGIPVQIGKSALSASLPEHLCLGACVREHLFQDGRLFFEKLSGEGPSWGWVSVRNGSDQLMQLTAGEAGAEAPTSASSGFVGPRLEVRMVNEDLGFCFDGYPAWVPHAAAVARLLREGRPYLPPPEDMPERLRGLRLAPFKLLSDDELGHMSKQDLPGCIFGIPFPHTADQLASDEFGPAWLTRAFHAAGTLAQDNKVTKIAQCKVLPTVGTDTPGAGAMKAILSVEYFKHEPDLHDDLFVKYPYECDYDSPLPFVRYSLSRGTDDHDGLEIAVNLALPHLFPFRTPKVYFCDICRETTNWILVQELLPFAKKGKMEDGHATEPELKPFDILPACNKHQDFLLSNPAEYYCCLFRKMGQLAAWDKLGRFDCFFGYSQPYSQEEFSSNLQREQQPVMKLVELQWLTGSAMDKAIDFVLNVVSHLVPSDICDEPKLQKMKEEIMEMAVFLGDFTGCYQFNDSSYIALMHPGCTTDNAFFWRDECGHLDCGFFDWGAFHRHPFCMWFDRCLNIVDPDMLQEHEHNILTSFVDDYHRCGGPKLPIEEVLLRFRMAYVQSLLEDIEKIDGILWHRGREELQAIRHISEDGLQSHYTTRVFVTMLLSKVAYYVRRGDFKPLFDSWCQGPGGPYLTPYV